MHLVDLDRVSLRYGEDADGTLALDGTTLQVRDGEFVAVVGESSAQGVPYNGWLSIGAIVAWQLDGLFPDRHARLHLLVISDKNVASYPIPDAGEVRIGRSPQCEIMVDDASISRVHASILTIIIARESRPM